LASIELAVKENLTENPSKAGIVLHDRLHRFQNRFPRSEGSTGKASPRVLPASS
jgi:hypothetical protein